LYLFIQYTVSVTALCHFSAVTNTLCSGEKDHSCKQSKWLLQKQHAYDMLFLKNKNFKWCYHAHLLTGTPLLWTLKVVWLDSETANPFMVKCVTEWRNLRWSMPCLGLLGHVGFSRSSYLWSKYCSHRECFYLKHSVPSISHFRLFLFSWANGILWNGLSEGIPLSHKLALYYNMQTKSTIGLIDLTCISQAYMIYEVNYIITSLFHVTCYCSRMGGSRIFKIVGKVIIFQYFLTSVPQHLVLLFYTFNNSSQSVTVSPFSQSCFVLLFITLLLPWCFIFPYNCVSFFRTVISNLSILVTVVIYCFQ
jgi:hypothetical protein